MILIHMQSLALPGMGDLHDELQHDRCLDWHPLPDHLCPNLIRNPCRRLGTVDIMPSMTIPHHRSSRELFLIPLLLH